MNQLPSEPNIQTFRAASLHEALQLVRKALGPDAAVLDVKQGQRSRLFGLLRGDSFVEVAASNEINVPSRLKRREDEESGVQPSYCREDAASLAPAPGADPLQTSGSGNGLTGNGLTGNGLTGNGLSGNGLSGNGLAGNGSDRPFNGGQAQRFAASSRQQDPLLPEHRESVNCPVSDARYAAETLTRDTLLSRGFNRPALGSSELDAGFGTPGNSWTNPPSPNLLGGGNAADSGSPWNAMLQSFQQRRYNGVENWTPALFKTYNDLIDADMSESVAKDLVFQVGSRLRGAQANHLPTIQNLLLEQISTEIAVTGPIVPKHRGHLVAMVGPTGVGKTTTIAKLAAHYSLNERRRVGLITVDTYRIAAVEQLRVYANIIDLPMLVVRNLQEMRQAVNRMRNLDLILMDTAGRGAKEELKIQELKTFIDEAKADEVQLVLSGTSASRSLCLAAQTFAQTGITSLIMTKLDEVLGLGNLLPLLRNSNLPYITNGQSVPEDFEVANALTLAHLALGHIDVMKRSSSLVRQ